MSMRFRKKTKTKLLAARVPIELVREIHKLAEKEDRYPSEIFVRLARTGLKKYLEELNIEGKI